MYKSGTIPQERVDMLNEVGFRLEWIHQDQKWDMRYAELQEFKKEFGHWIVPQNYERNKKLGTWVIHQRRQLKSRQLRHDRFQKLDEIGFVWNGPNTGRKKFLVPVSGLNLGQTDANGIKVCAEDGTAKSTVDNTDEKVEETPD
ncbi:hypothetical protein ACHAXN_012313 [Cyclotella atomus]